MTTALTTSLAAFFAAHDIDVHVVVALMGITFIAAVINGAVGYGFSSVTVPSGLLFTTQKLLNPVLVVVEVALNGVGVVINRAGLREARPLLKPVLLGLVPGVAVGAALLGVIAALPLKTVTFAILLPLCLLQLRHRNTRTTTVPTRTTAHGDGVAGAGFGFGLGVLYATTTLSGPPLALFLGRRAVAQDTFRAAMAAVRLAESVLTVIAYSVIGLLHVEAVMVAACIVPSVALGLPIGRRLLRALSPATFRVLVLGLDVVLITVGLLTSLRQLFGPSPVVVVAMVVVGVVVIATPLVSLLRGRAQAAAERKPDVFAAQPS